MCVLLRSGGLGELLDDFPVAEVLLHRVGHEPRGGPLAAVVVSDVKPLRHLVMLEYGLKQGHHVTLPDVPLDGLGHVPAAEDVQNRQHLGIGTPSLDVNILDIKFKVAELGLGVGYQLLNPLTAASAERASFGKQ